MRVLLLTMLLVSCNGRPCIKSHTEGYTAYIMVGKIMVPTYRTHKVCVMRIPEPLRGDE